MNEKVFSEKNRSMFANRAIYCKKAEAAGKVRKPGNFKKLNDEANRK